MPKSDVRIDIKADSAQASLQIKKLTKDIGLLNKKVQSGGKLNVKQIQQTSRSITSLTSHVSKLAIIYGTFHSLVSGGVVTAEFEQSIKRLGVYSGTSGEELERLKNKALDLGKTTVFSATQVADGMNQMALAGLTAQEQFDGIEAVLNLASVGMISLTDASNIAVTAMKSFGLQASDIGDISDILAKASTISATTITELGQALTKVGTEAHSHNISLEETASALGVLADAGRRGAEAGTQLKIVMARLSGNVEAKKWLDKLHISMYDATTKGALPFAEQLKIVRDRLAKLPPQARAIKLSQIFGEEAKSSAVALMTSLDELDAKLGKIRKAMGDNFAQKSAKEMMDTLQGSYKSLLSALEGLTLEMGQNLIPILRESMDSVTGFIRGMDKDKVREFADALGGLIQIIGSFIGDVVSLAGGIINLIDAHQHLAAALGGLIVATKLSISYQKASIALTIAGTSASKLHSLAVAKEALATRGLTRAMKAFLLNPYVLAIAGIISAYSIWADRQEAVTKNHEKSVKSIENEVKARDHALARVETYFNKTAQGYFVTNKERTKELGLIGQKLNETEKLLDQGQRENETDADWIKRKAVMEKSVTLLSEGINKLVGAKDKDILKTKLQKEAWEKFGVVPAEQTANIEKLRKKYVALEISASSAISKLINKEASLNKQLKELAIDKFNIERKYYNERLDLEDEYANRIEGLEQIISGKTLTQLQKKQNILTKYLDREKLAYKELYSGNLTQASKYFDQLLSMSDKLTIGSLGADGKRLNSAKEVAQEKLRITKLVKDAKLYALEQEKIKELEANKVKTETALLDLKMTKLQLTAQKEYLKNLQTLTQVLTDKPITFTNDVTTKSIKDLDKMTSDLKSKLTGINVDIQTRKANLELTGLDNKLKNLSGTVEVGADTSTGVKKVNNFISHVSKVKTKTQVEANTNPAVKGVKKLVRDIHKQKPTTQNVVADVNNAYIPVLEFVKYVGKQTPYLNIYADTNNVYSPVIDAINWINSQVAYIDVYTRHHNAGGGYIPQKLATGGVFTGSGRVQGYDPTDSDSVSAKLTGGEFVIKREAVDSYGLSLLHAINSMNYQTPTPKFATGGLVGNKSSENSTSSLQPINLNVGGNKGFSMFADKEVAEALQRYLQANGDM